MYSMNAFIGRDLAGDIARSQARFCFSFEYDDETAIDEEDGAATALPPFF
jgi:hypothetical protein